MPKDLLYQNRVPLTMCHKRIQGRYSMLELDEGKLSRPVLRRGVRGNSDSLADRGTTGAWAWSVWQARARAAPSLDTPPLARAPAAGSPRRRILVRQVGQVVFGLRRGHGMPRCLPVMIVTW